LKSEKGRIKKAGLSTRLDLSKSSLFTYFKET